MLTILGSTSSFGAPCSRRAVMHVGGLGAASLGLPQVLFQEAAAANHAAERPLFGKAKRILLLYLQGAASQFETWDPKPDAPEEVRGQWGAIPTSVPGTFICEHLPRIAALADRIAIVRSMTHDHNNHSNLYTLTGHPAIDFSSETNPHDNRHHPFFASVIDYLEERSGPKNVSEVPQNIGLPWKFSTHSPFVRRAGPYAAFLGDGYDPVWTQFDGTATHTVKRVSFFSRLKGVEVEDPYLGVTPESRLRVSKSAVLRDGMTIDRLNRRLSLVEQFDRERRQLSESLAGQSVDRFTEMAYTLMTSPKLRNALDVGQEPMSVREQYGMTLFGQAALTGRRLLEAGCKLVSVFWDEYKVVNTAWDTHFNLFTRLGDELLPGFDAAVSNLLLDMEARGMLDDTLVMCLTEHGRTPKIDDRKGGGRGHWSKAYSVMLAGAGIRGGTVLGASDSQGAYVQEDPVSPEDILATMYHLKGIDYESTIPDRLNRPIKLVQNGSIVRGLLSAS